MSDLQSLIKTFRGIHGIYDKIDNRVLAIREELIGISALNPFADKNSASRGLMQTGQFSQLAVLLYPELTLVQEGISYQLAKNTWKCIVEEDCVVRHIISSKDSHDIENTETILLLVELYDGTMDIIDVPLYYSVSEFGFRYKRNVEKLSTIMVGSKLTKGTVLAETPGVIGNAYGYGVNAHMKLVTHPDVGQDGIVVSNELMERMAYRTYHKFEANINQDSILLNRYGNLENYIGLPKVGDTVPEDGIVMAIRRLDSDNLTPTVYDTMIIDPIYDECYYMPHNTKKITIKGKEIYNNKVISVKVYNSPSKKVVNQHCKENIDNNAEELKTLHRRVIASYNKHENKNKLTPRAHKSIVESLSIASPELRTELRYRNEVFTTRVEIVVETTHIPGVGNKLTDRHGTKN